MGKLKLMLQSREFLHRWEFGPSCLALAATNSQWDRNWSDLMARGEMRMQVLQSECVRPHVVKARVFGSHRAIGCILATGFEEENSLSCSGRSQFLLVEMTGPSLHSAWAQFGPPWQTLDLLAFSATGVFVLHSCCCSLLYLQSIYSSIWLVLSSFWQALEKGVPVDVIHKLTAIDKWFLCKMRSIVNMEKILKEVKQ